MALFTHVVKHFTRYMMHATVSALHRPSHESAIGPPHAPNTMPTAVIRQHHTYAYAARTVPAQPALGLPELDVEDALAGTVADLDSGAVEFESGFGREEAAA